jgi:hypothetical protein
MKEIRTIVFLKKYYSLSECGLFEFEVGDVLHLADHSRDGKLDLLDKRQCCLGFALDRLRAGDVEVDRYTEATDFKLNSQSIQGPQAQLTPDQFRNQMPQ